MDFLKAVLNSLDNNILGLVGVNAYTPVYTGKNADAFYAADAKMQKFWDIRNYGANIVYDAMGMPFSAGTGGPQQHFTPPPPPGSQEIPGELIVVVAIVLVLLIIIIIT